MRVLPEYLAYYAGAGRGWFVVKRIHPHGARELVTHSGPYTTREQAQAEADSMNGRTLWPGPVWKA